MRSQLLADTLVRQEDPATSQAAARDTAVRVRVVREGVLELVQLCRRISSSQINAEYANRRERHRWARAAHDTPRKRAGELAAPHRGLLYLAVVDTAIGENGRAESVYALTERGRQHLAAHS